MVPDSTLAFNISKDCLGPLQIVLATVAIFVLVDTSSDPGPHRKKFVTLPFYFHSHGASLPISHSKLSKGLNKANRVLDAG